MTDQIMRDLILVGALGELLTEVDVGFTDVIGEDDTTRLTRIIAALPDPTEDERSANVETLKRMFRETALRLLALEVTPSDDEDEG